MRVDLKVFGLLKEVICDAYFLVGEDTSLEDLLLKMGEKYGREFAQQVFDPDKKKIQDDIGISVNGQFVKGDLSAARLKEGDRIAFFILVAGG
jgi:molybdopterin converting factor small subunit